MRSDRRPTITAAIIALNEADNLTDLLPQLDWVDEVVVIDGGSRDATCDVVRRHEHVRLLTHPFDTFARQRNRAIGASTGDWILSIDADERPTVELRHEITRRIADPCYAAYHVPIRSSILGKKLRRCGTQDDRPVRLFRRDSARWIGDVHEVLQVEGRIGRLDAWLNHTTLPDLHAFMAKMDRYTRLESRARVAAGCVPRRRDRWIAPVRETFRRLIWKMGLLDGPTGWRFCLLSGLSAHVLARRHRRLWQIHQATVNPPEERTVPHA